MGRMSDEHIERSEVMTAHDRDCAVHKTYGSDHRPGPCDCGAEQAKETAHTPEERLQKINWLGEYLNPSQIRRIAQVLTEAIAETAAERDRLKEDNEVFKNDYNRLGREYAALKERNVALVEALGNCAESLNLWLSKAGCQTEDAALKSDAEDFGGLDALREARAALKTGEARDPVTRPG